MLQSLPLLAATDCTVQTSILHSRPPSRDLRRHRQQSEVAQTQSEKYKLDVETRRQHRLQHRGEVQHMAHIALRSAHKRHVSRMQRTARPCHTEEQLVMEAYKQEDIASPQLTVRQFINQNSVHQRFYSREEEVALAHVMHTGEVAQQTVQSLSQKPLPGATGEEPSQPLPHLSILLSEIHAGAVATSKLITFCYGLLSTAATPNLKQQLAYFGDHTVVAKRKLMKSCHGLVFKIVTPYLKQHQVPVEDLLMAGLTGVQMGVQKFDPERGNRLSTMVYMWTFSQVQATFREMAAGIHISAKARADANRIVAAQQQHPDGTQVQAHLMEQVRLQVGLTKIRFANAMRASKMQEMSLDSPPPTAAIASDGADALLETIAADEAVGLEDDVCLANLAVQQALQQLPQREATFIQHMYGLVDGIPMNRAQVAKAMGLSAHHARKVEQQAFSRLHDLPIAQEKCAHQYW